MPIHTSRTVTMSTSETEFISVSYNDYLRSGELLTGTPTVAEVTTSDLTIANVARNTAAYTDVHTGDTVAIDEAVQFAVTTPATKGKYKVSVTVSTDSTPARAPVRIVHIEVV